MHDEPCTDSLHSSLILVFLLLCFTYVSNWLYHFFLFVTRIIKPFLSYLSRSPSRSIFLCFLSHQNIFQGKDIRDQLPQECNEFEDVSANWKIVMTRLHEENNAVKGSHHPGMTSVKKLFFREHRFIKAIFSTLKVLNHTSYLQGLCVKQA